MAELIPLASPRSAGQTLLWQDEQLQVQPVTAEGFAGIDLVLASAGGSVSKQWAPVAAAAGAVVIDNSSAFRMDAGVPLVVPVGIASRVLSVMPLPPAGARHSRPPRSF